MCEILQAVKIHTQYCVSDSRLLKTSVLRMTVTQCLQNANKSLTVDFTGWRVANSISVDATHDQIPSMRKKYLISRKAESSSCFRSIIKARIIFTSTPLPHTYIYIHRCTSGRDSCNFLCLELWRSSRWGAGCQTALGQERGGGVQVAAGPQPPEPPAPSACQSRRADVL